MKLGEIYEHLNQISPFNLQESWDNSGLQIGNFELSVKQICLSLDVDKNLLKNVDENTLIITHHPLIFKGLKSLDFSFYPSNLIEILIKKNISLISMHTNFDKTHLNLHVAKNVLKFDILKIEDFMIYLNIQKNFNDLCLHVKKALDIKHLRVVESKNFIKTAVLTTGSGGDFVQNVKADCFLTGDMKYHQALMAKENTLGIIDIGHYESERYFADALAPYLKNFSLKVIMSNHKNPFEYK